MILDPSATYWLTRIGGGVSLFIRILFGSVKSATFSVTVGLLVPGFGYLNERWKAEVIEETVKPVINWYQSYIGYN